ncbi:MAG: DUF5615 family PIN-like protein [Anaerolineae bacterium]|nr:DUF5615 family PIN-like protein [Anaerolineae bacterium]
MIHFLADENFDNTILRGVQRRHAEFSFLRVQDTVMYEAADPLVLEWAAAHGYVLLTHDTATMIGFAYERINAGLPMAGVIRVPKDLSLGEAIDDLVLMAGASEPGDWENKVTHLPLR